MDVRHPRCLSRACIYSSSQGYPCYRVDDGKPHCRCIFDRGRIITWVVAFCARLIHIPGVLYYEEKNRADRLHRERHQEDVLREIAMLRARVARLRIEMEQDVQSLTDWEPEFEGLRAEIARKIQEYSNAAEAEIFTTAGNLRDRSTVVGTNHDLYINFCIRDLDWPTTLSEIIRGCGKGILVDQGAYQKGDDLWRGGWRCDRARRSAHRCGAFAVGTYQEVRRRMQIDLDYASLVDLAEPRHAGAWPG
jgi:hypothetical protein